MSEPPLRICFVCLGNICRSPTAEAVMRRRVEDAGVDHRVHVESAGTGSWHVGDPPDGRASAEGHARGIPLRGAARQFQREDFERFDVVVAMDRQNEADLSRLARGGPHVGKIHLLRSFDGAAAEAGHLDVPDPYYGGDAGFAQVFDLVDDACQGLLEALLNGEPPRR